MTNTDTRPQFEDAIWAHYQGLKARGWSAPEEGDPSSRESLFWREANGQYGVRQIEAAWRGWCMRDAAEGWAEPGVFNLGATVDIMLADGSVLCGCIPQMDGDLWWDGAGTGERFIDPVYTGILKCRVSQNI